MTPERDAAYWRGLERERPRDIVTPGPGQESVWDYPRPPRIDPVAQEIRVELSGRVIARSTAALRVVETSGAPVYYLPPRDVDLALLSPGTRRSLCEWKGEAVYWSVSDGADRIVREAAWSYPRPAAGFEALRDHPAFYPQLMDGCFVAGERAIPQPGGFYGGWVTSAIVGPFKGAPGSDRW